MSENAYFQLTTLYYPVNQSWFVGLDLLDLVRLGLLTDLEESLVKINKPS